MDTSIKSSSAQKIPLYQSLDLSRHAVIQASAGTGKTYTIERLILRYLVQAEENNGNAKFHLEDILLVTFTDKATGELKERIRQKIAEAIEALRNNAALSQMPVGSEDTVLSPQAMLSHLQTQLQNFDRAQIFTIHGFCSKVIKDHAFLCHLPMQIEMTDGREIAERLLRNYLNSDQGQHAAALSEESVAKWIKQASTILNELADKSDLKPGVPDETTLDGLQTKFLGALTKLDSLSEEEYQLLLVRCNRLKGGKPGKARTFNTPSRQKLLEGFKYLSTVRSTEQLVDWLETYHPNWASKPQDDRPTVTALDNLRDDPTPVCRRFMSIFEQTLCGLISTHKILLQSRIQNEYLELLSRYQALKKDASQLTFNDLISTVHKQITANDSGLRRKLKQQYKVGIIDEFQDTSRRQWEIFKALFIEDVPSKSLIVVGDEKQSIYGFQGAEVSTCLQAIEEIKSAGGQCETLDTNYRSTAAMIMAYNGLFRSASWFGEYSPDDPTKANRLSGLGRGYQDVYCGDNTKTPGFTPDTPLWLCDLSTQDDGKPLNLAKKRQALCHWTVKAIQYLIDQCSVTPQDIAILVEKNHEASDIIDALRKAGYPVAKIKEEGLFRSRFNLNFITALDAINEYKDSGKVAKLALTDFFLGKSVNNAVPSASAENSDDRQLDDVITEQKWVMELSLKVWVELSQKRKWGRLFSALFEQSYLYQNIKGDNKRPLMAYRQLRSYALKHLLETNDSLSALIRRLRSLYLGELDEAEQEKIFHKETSKPAIQMLTLHKSKGLEFPYVFIPSGSSGFTDKASANGFRRIFDTQSAAMKIELDYRNETAKKQEQGFHFEEKMRLWYVGVTRAEKLLALPYWGELPGKANGSAANRFLNNALETAMEHDSTRAFFTQFTPGHQWHSVSNCEATMPLPNAHVSSRTELTQPEAITDVQAVNLNAYPVNLHTRAWLNTSASGLMQANHNRGILKDDDGSDADFMLPKGKQTGNMLHDMLEKIVFGKQTTAEADNLVKQYFPRLTSDAIDQYVRHSLDLLDTALAQQIPTTHGSHFRLKDIDQSRCVAEPQFHFTFDHQGKLFPAHKNNIKGWVQGFIDLMFEHQGKYYIVDWKSTYLERYDQSYLDAAMQKHDYQLQAALYLKALQALLAQQYPSQPIADKLGGVIYVFLRASENNPADTEHSGIWFKTPSQLAGLISDDHINHKLLGLIGSVNEKEEA